MPPSVKTSPFRVHRSPFAVSLRLLACVLPLFTAGLLSAAGVVLNEVMYHPPDDHDELQFIELHNAGSATADLAGWSFAKGVKLTFPAGSKLAPGGFGVVCPASCRQRRPREGEPQTNTNALVSRVASAGGTHGSTLAPSARGRCRRSERRFSSGPPVGRRFRGRFQTGAPN